jgi:hypothetical protein
VSQSRLLFVVNGLRRLFADEHFVTSCALKRCRHCLARLPNALAPLEVPCRAHKDSL